MNILHINTFSHSGGAAKAALRLVEAQSRLGVNAKLLVAFKEKEQELVFTAYKSNLLFSNLSSISTVYSCEKRVVVVTTSKKDSDKIFLNITFSLEVEDTNK